jgi:hypothetical protein
VIKESIREELKPIIIEEAVHAQDLKKIEKILNDLDKNG